MHNKCVCGAENYRTTLKEKDCSVLRCQKCGLSRTWPPPFKADEVGSFYDGYEDYYDRINRLDLWRRFSARSLKFLKKYRSTGRLIDVGANVGVFVKEAAAAGYDAFGSDLSSRAVRFGEARLALKGRLFPGRLADINFSDNSFDVVTYLHVLEHIEELDRELGEAKRILKPGGIIYLEAPNYDSIWRRVLRGKWYGMAASQHFWQFTKRSLTKLLERNGFVVLTSDTSGNMHHQVTADFRGSAKLAILAIAKLFRLGDNLVVVAKK